jgi:hypothetical protein
MARIDKQLAGHKSLAHRVLIWVVGARRPLTTAELQQALGVEVGKPVLDAKNLTPVDLMVSVCAGLVTVDAESDIIRLIHATARDYLEQQPPHPLLSTTPEADMAAVCVSYLSLAAFSNSAVEAAAEQQRQQRQQRQEKRQKQRQEQRQRK